MSAGAIAERYAQALFELGVEAGQQTKLAEQLTQFAAAYDGSRELRATLSNPVTTADQQRAVLTTIAKKIGVSELGIKGLLVMAGRGRLSALRATAARLTEMCDAKDGVARASVVTASKMPESFYQSLSKQLATATKKKILLERSIDESLLGGAIARMGDVVIDGSVRGRLARVEQELLQAISTGS